MADTKTDNDDPMVKAYMLRNSSHAGQLLRVDTVVELPRSVATELRDRGTVRKPSKAEAATFREAAKAPAFGEEPEDES
jgi:hypothetical protein